MRRIKVDLFPPRRAHFLWVVWALWATLAVGTLCLSAFSIFGKFQTHNSKGYSGYLETTSLLNPIPYMQEIPLSEIVAKNGEEVRVGQIIAHYDRREIDLKIHAARTTIISLEALLNCLTGGKFSTREQTTDDVYNASISIEASQALSTCKTLRLENIQARSRLIERRERLKRQIYLLVKKVENKGMSFEDEKASAAFRASVTVKFKIAMSEIETEISRIEEMQKKTLLEKIEQTKSEIQLLETEIETLTKLSKAPWVTATASGYLEGMTEPSLALKPEADSSLGQIRSKDDGEFNFYIQVDFDDLKRLNSGQSVSISSTEQARNFPAVQANIREITPLWQMEEVDHKKVRVKLLLQASSEKPDHTDNSIHSYDSVENLQVLISAEKQTVSASLHQSLNRAIFKH